MTKRFKASLLMILVLVAAGAIGWFAYGKNAVQSSAAGTKNCTFNVPLKVAVINSSSKENPVPSAAVKARTSECTNVTQATCTTGTDGTCTLNLKSSDQDSGYAIWFIHAEKTSWWAPYQWLFGYRKTELRYVAWRNSSPYSVTLQGRSF